MQWNHGIVWQKKELWGGKLSLIRVKHCKKMQSASPRRNNGKRGLVAGTKVIGQVLLSRETFHCPPYSEKFVRVETCHNLSVLLKDWRQRMTQVFEVYCARLTWESERIHQYQPSLRRIEHRPTLFFLNIKSSGPYAWSILTDQSSFIVLCRFAIAMGTAMILRK